MRTRLLTVAAVVVATAGTLGGPAPAQAGAPATPEVGQCHQLTVRQIDADADPKAAVPCSRRHDLTTVAVATSSTSLTGMTIEERQALGLRLCLPKVDRALGRTAAKRALSAYTTIYFSPTTEQIAAGARWFRCDVGLEAGRRMAPLPRRLHRPILPSRLTDDERRCLTRTHLGTTCSRPHAYRSSGTFRMHGSALPTPDQFLAAATERCRGDWAWASWPGANSWAAGHRNVVCFEETKH